MRRFAALILLVLPLGGCDSSTGPEVNHLGTYLLQTIRGEPIPVVVLDLGLLKLEVVAMTVELKSRGKFESSATFRSTDDGVVTTDTDTVTGKYTLTGTLLTLVHEGETRTGTLVGETMTLTDPDGDMVLVKV